MKAPSATLCSGSLSAQFVRGDGTQWSEGSSVDKARRMVLEVL